MFESSGSVGRGWVRGKEAIHIETVSSHAYPCMLRTMNREARCSFLGERGHVVICIFSPCDVLWRLCILNLNCIILAIAQYHAVITFQQVWLWLFQNWKFATHASRNKTNRSCTMKNKLSRLLLTKPHQSQSHILFDMSSDLIKQTMTACNRTSNHNKTTSILDDC